MTRQKIVIVADDHPLIRQSLAGLVSGLFPYVKLYSGTGATRLTELVRQHEPADGEFTVMDVTVPAEPDAGAAPASPDSPLMMVTARDADITARWFVALEPTPSETDPTASIETALTQGEAVQDLIRQLQDAARREGRDVAEAAGGLPPIESLVALGLTHRQAEVLRYLAEGQSNKEIARVLDVSEWTVRHHVSAILERLEVSNRMRAANLARSLGQG